MILKIKHRIKENENFLLNQHSTKLIAIFYGNYGLWFFFGGGRFIIEDYFLLKLPLDSFIFIINNKPNFFIITSIVNLVHLFGLLII